MEISALIFYLLAVVIVGSALIVAFSRNIMYTVFSLLATFAGVAGLYVMLSADFLAGTQVLVYVGGILVLLIFAVMLTNRIGDIRVSNQPLSRAPALLVSVLVWALLVYVAVSTPWQQLAKPAMEATTAKIGDALLREYLLPFELVSVALVGALIGAASLARKEVRPEK